jgi:hypothetical protein
LKLRESAPKVGYRVGYKKEQVNALDPVLLILLGWALGLFTPRITDAIRRPYRARDLRAALVAELFGLQHTMVAVAFSAAGIPAWTTRSSRLSGRRHEVQ